MLNVKDQMCTTVNEEKCSTVVDQECRIVDDKQCRYNGRRLDQYNKDDVSLISNKIFLFLKKTETANWQLFFVSMFMCIHFVWQLGRNHFHCIYIYGDDVCSFLQQSINNILS